MIGYEDYHLAWYTYVCYISPARDVRITFIQTVYMVQVRVVDNFVL